MCHSSSLDISSWAPHSHDGTQATKNLNLWKWWFTKKNASQKSSSVEKTTSLSLTSGASCFIQTRKLAQLYSRISVVPLLTSTNGPSRNQGPRRHRISGYRPRALFSFRSGTPSLKVDKPLTVERHSM